jgi:hypothetical protein
MTFDAIAEWFNKEGYLTVRGKRFRGTHVHSILKKRLAKEQLLNREHPPVWSNFSMEVVDKTILMSDFFGVPSKRWVFLLTPFSLPFKSILCYIFFMRNLTATICLTIAVLLGTHAQAGTYSCQVKRVGGNPETLKITPYSEIGVSLIINRRTSEISYSYAEHGTRWENIFKILQEDVNSILGVENFELNRVRVITFNKIEKTVRFMFISPEGNTLHFGKCYD